MRKNLPVIVAIVLPILVVVGVLISIYLPTVGLQPGYNLVIASNNDKAWSYYDEEARYVVVGQKIQRLDLKKQENSKNIGPAPESQISRLYIYDFDKEQIQEITYEEAQNLSIIKAGNVSPDGYRAIYSQGGNNLGIFEIFGGYSRDYGLVISKNGKSIFKKIDELWNNYYGTEILGWINK